jgi:hypothetical protein
MPQLTAQFERVVIYGLLNTDDNIYDFLLNIKLVQMIQEIRISEDYCISDIVIVDFGQFNLGHLSKLSVTNVKKYETCVLVSSLEIRSTFNRP